MNKLPIIVDFEIIVAIICVYFSIVITFMGR